MRLVIQKILGRLPEAYSAETYATKCDLVYQHVHDSYYGRGAIVYERFGRVN